MATVEALCISTRKGIVKHAIELAEFKTGWGIADDAHAGEWHRQVSLLAGESIDRVKEVLPQLREGAFAENIITRGLDLATVRIGDRLTINDQVILEVTQIGKKCHNDGCAIKKATGECIMPREGIFAIAIAGGPARPGDRITMVRERETGAEISTQRLTA